MTAEDLIKRYNIPLHVINEYDCLKLCEGCQYDDEDLKSLSMIITLYDMGFDRHEVEGFMKLLLKGECTEEERLKILNQKRDNTLAEIHFKEKQLDKIDYMRYKMKNK